MLHEAPARPGVRVIMEVYDGWREKDRGLDAWREDARQHHDDEPHPSLLIRRAREPRIEVRRVSESTVERIAVSSRMATGGESK